MISMTRDADTVNGYGLVSVIIPTKNRCELLRETLASIAAQTYANWEAIVVDDGSEDETHEMVQRIAATEKRIRFVRRERMPVGAPTCRNIGVSAAQGEFIIFLDSDDLLAPTCLEGRVRALEGNPNADFVVSLTQIFHSMPGDSPYLWNNFTEQDDLDRFLLRDLPWHTSGALWRKKSLEQTGPWDERARSAQDLEFHVRALAAGLNYLKIPRVDSYWRSTRVGAISSSWFSRRYIFNRACLLKRLIAHLHSHGLLTAHRRRILAGEFHLHAFRMRLRRQLGLKIWTAGRHAGVVTMSEFLLILFGEGTAWAADYMNFRLARWLFPQLRLSKTHLKAVLPPSCLNPHLNEFGSAGAGNHRADEVKLPL